MLQIIFLNYLSSELVKGVVNNQVLQAYSLCDVLFGALISQVMASWLTCVSPQRDLGLKPNVDALYSMLVVGRFE